MTTKEDKERFVKMLKARQIICFCVNNPRRKNYDYKIIGANNDGKWDFTRMAADVSNYPNNNGCQYLTIRSPHNAEDVVADILDELSKDGIFDQKLSGYALTNFAREHIAIFYAN